MMLDVYEVHLLLSASGAGVPRLEVGRTCTTCKISWNSTAFHSAIGSQIYLRQSLNPRKVHGVQLTMQEARSSFKTQDIGRS